MEFTKEQIRSTIKTMATFPSKSDLENESNLIQERLLQLEEVKNSQLICCYISVDGEVNTAKFIEAVLKDNKELCVPYYFPESDSYKLAKIDSETKFVLGKYKIPEPEKIIEVEELPDLILVPAVAYDSRLNRVGHGNGYYDRMLAPMDKTIKIGLAFAYQMIQKVPAIHTDIAMDKIVLADRSYQSCRCCTESDSCTQKS